MSPPKTKAVKTDIRSVPYSIEVFWSEEDAGYIAKVRDLPGCSAWGESPAEAIEEVQLAISAWIEAAKAAGNPVPPPTTERSAQSASGKFVVRVPKVVHAELVRRADAEGVSLNHLVSFALSCVASDPNYFIRRNQPTAVAAETAVSEDAVTELREKVIRRMVFRKATVGAAVTGRQNVIAYLPLGYRLANAGGLEADHTGESFDFMTEIADLGMGTFQQIRLSKQ